MRRKIKISTRMMAVYLVLTLLFPPLPTFAGSTVPTAGGSTTVAPARNSVPVVNIAAPNAAGLSHNTYISYNVDAQGLVLNNGDKSQLFRQSQLAGQVAANPNLAAGTQASIILNEVTSSNRSVLAGFTEVLGGKAAVIVANPYGITCTGCGFINTDRVSLVTGTPNFTAGALSGFGVNGGDILISGTGINASAQQVLDLVSRKIVIQGQVNAQTLNLTAGTNTWDYATGAATPTAPGAGAPVYAIDSSALGGMYAGRISLKATEAGVGVRMLGNAAASTDDFTITSAGKIEIVSQLSAARDLSLTSTSTVADAIKVTDANLSAGRNLGLTATSGGATLSGGVLVATNNLNYNLGTLTDAATATGIVDNNKRYAGGSMVLDGTNDWTMDGVNYGAAGALSATVGSLVIGGSGATLYAGGIFGLRATGGDLNMANAALKSPGNMTLTSDTGKISFGSGAKVQSTTGNLSLTADASLENAGTLTADAGNVIARVNGLITNSGTVHAFGLLDVADKSSGATENISNTGMLHSGAMTVKASALSVTGGAVIETTGDMELTLGSLAVGGAGDTTSRIVAATSGSGAATITLASLFNNYGIVHSGYDLTLTSPALTNMSTGGISALNNLTVRATGGDLLNQGALYAGNDLTASASGTFTNDATLATVLGTLDADRDMTLSAGTFINHSRINAARDISITAPIFRNEIKGGGAREWYNVSPPEDTYLGSTGWVGCGVDQCLTITMRRDWTDSQRYIEGAPSHLPQIIGGNSGTVNILGFNTGSNLGGKISGGTVNFTGNGGGSTFTNDDLPLLWRDSSFTFHYYSEDWLVGDSGIHSRYQDQSGTTVAYTLRSTLGGGIRANTLNMGAFGLSNLGSPYVSSPTSRTAPTTGFPGLTLTLPTNPNGVFILAASPGSSYLVESNPLFTNVDNFLGSDYLAAKYNFKPDELIKRLGDAGYETFLVQQQLVAQTGGKLLRGYDTEKEQMKGLMDSAGSQSKELGLSYGRALSARQQANLKEDMVWMVETTVNGQKVLAPVVYLAASTRQMFADDGGGTIAAKNANLNLTSLTNKGGTISGSSTLNITTQSDIKNVSGTIKGGNVALTSTQGSIINQTQAEVSGDDTWRKTDIGKQAGILSTGTMSLDAAKDITNLGAKMAAGADASLSAGGNITFDTVENKTTTTTGITGGAKTVKTTDQIKSELAADGKLAIKSKNDITLAGTDVTAGKSASLDAGGGLNILARNNTREEITNTAKEGFGVAGGLYGKESSSTDHFTSTNNGSTVTVGKGNSGALDVTAGKTVTVKGSDLAAKDMNINAADVKVLAGENVDRTTTKTEKTSWLSISSGSDATSSSEAKAASSAGKNTSTGSVKSAASASASADASYAKDGGGLDFKKTIKNETTDETKTSVGSKLSATGNITINTKKDITIQGSDVKAGGDVALKGENVNILAAENSHTTTSKSETTKVGLYGKTSNSAGANADAKAGAAAGVAAAGASAGVSADAGATAKTTNSLDFYRSNKTETETKDTTHTGSTITSGGNLAINAKNTLAVQGSDLSGEKSVDLKAKDMSFTAAADTTYSKTTSSSTSVGLYVDGTANAKAGAKAGASALNGVEAGGSAGASASAELSIGVQVDSKNKTNISGSSTDKVSSIKSGSGSITRTATGGITDVGTTIEAANDFSQSAKTIDSQAAKNTTYSSETTANTNVKVGVYAKAEAGVSADANAKAPIKGASEANASGDVTAKVGAGISVNVNNDNSKSDSSTSTAVVSTIKAGGKIKSTSTDKTTLEGTQMTSGGKTEVSADSLEFKAAKNTTSESSTSNKTGVSAKIGVSRGTGSGIDASLDVAVGDKNSTSASSTAVVGSIKSGGDLIITTTKNAAFEGSTLDSGGNASVKAGGNLTFSAAKNTASSSSNSVDVGVNASLEKPTGKSRTDTKSSGGTSVDYTNEKSSSSDAVTGRITSKGKLDLSAGNNATFEGTKIASGGDATIAAGGNVEMRAARSTSSSESFGLGVGVKGNTEKDVKSNGTTTNSKYGQATVGASTSKADSSTADVGSVSSGGNLKISSGKNSTFEGTELAADKKVTIDAGGSATFNAAKNTDTSSGFGLSVTGAAQRTTRAPSTPVKGGTAPASGSTGDAKDKKADSTAPAKDKKADSTAPAKDKKADTSAPAEKDKKSDSTAPLKPEVTDMLKQAPSGTVGSSIAKGTGVPNLGDTVKRTDVGVGVGLKVSNNSATTYTAGTIKAGKGGIEINAKGGDVNFESTKLTSDGDKNVAATGKVNQTTVSDKTFGINLDVKVPVITVKSKTTTTKAGADPKADKKAKAEEKAKSKADEKAKTKAAAEEKAKTKAEEKARAAAAAASKAAAKAKVNAAATPEEKAKAKAEERANSVAESKAAINALVKVEEKAQAKAKIKADEKAMKKADEKVKEEAEQKASSTMNVLRTDLFKPKITAPPQLDDPNAKKAPPVYTNDPAKAVEGTSRSSLIIKEGASFTDVK